MAGHGERTQDRGENALTRCLDAARPAPAPPLESAFVRVIATGGVIGIGVALGAILSSQKVAGWITGLVIALVSVILSAILWSSRRL